MPHAGSVLGPSSPVLRAWEGQIQDVAAALPELLEPEAGASRRPVRWAVRTGCATAGCTGLRLSQTWQVEASHDLDAERVAEALGAPRSGCGITADVLLPAVRHWLQLMLHRQPSAMQVDPHFLKWVAVRPDPSCTTCSTGLPSPAALAQHLRNREHLRHVCNGADGLKTLEDIMWQLHLEHGLGRLDLARAPVAPAAVSRAEVAGYLWDVGFSGLLLTRIHAAAGARSPLPVEFYLAILPHIPDRR
jgi:hypothetical protein